METLAVKTTDALAPANKAFTIKADITADKISQFVNYLKTFDLMQTASITPAENNVRIDVETTDKNLQDFALFSVHLYPGVERINISLA